MATMMDGKQFDHVVKSFADTGSRRRVVQVGLAVAAGLAAPRVVQDVKAKDKSFQKCERDCATFFGDQSPERQAACLSVCNGCKHDIRRVCDTSATNQTLICCDDPCYFYCGDAS